ncbi:hypothetical protein HS088_TW05G00650 [Tripterygium wilfordii]|uniref:BZIP domain-containing protein n=1 Tax=Tripterygium wilfordii TaxID=458696 RepID=A0A7J7DNH7_TRIWF|nr:bZIP transcription factor 17 [Tripterygium wilfordii]KAF5747920.1 hypothetical protein HS088_TW05G00650 [Tripterygium wilfordii]
MEDSFVAEPPLEPNSDANVTFDSDCLQVPPLDPFLGDQDFDLAENFDIELCFDDFFPSENEPFLIPNHSDSTVAPLQCVDTNAVQPEYQGLSPISIDQSLSSDPNECFSNGSRDIPISVSFESRNLAVPGKIPGDLTASDVSQYLNCSSEESGNCGLADGGPARGPNVASPVSSQDSRNSGSGVSEATNSPLSPDSGNFVVDQRVKEEGLGNNGSITKRKKETSDDTNGDARTSKYQRSETGNNTSSRQQLSEEDEKRRARLMRNRESAQLSRQRKKHYVEELEDKVRSMHSAIAELNGKLSYFMAENTSLRQQLSASGMCPPPPGVYPPMGGPMAYPWVPCSPYMVKPQGSQVPLVPIPRLKPQQPVSAAKVKKTESKKSEGKTKKVASVSFLGLLFFIFLFGGLVPVVNVRFGGIRDNGPGGSGVASHSFYDQHSGRVLEVNGHLNSSHENFGMGYINGKLHVGKAHCEKGHTRGSEKERGSQPLSSSEEFAHLGNSSEPLVASLYVPRNDKLVKIDGNLIIHSVLASERAMASRKAPEKKNNEETGLAIPRDLAPAFAIPDVGSSKGRHSRAYSNRIEGQRALTSGSADALKDHLKSSAADGKMQQWFREGLAGPMLSSGMCTEVFQFDVSSASAGAIIPASSVANISAEHNQNATRHKTLNKRKTRRILHGLPVRFTGRNHNITREHVRRNAAQEGNFQHNKSVSSMVVSILADPREVGDVDVDGMIAPKSLSRIFVVVLLDSVKYVTYSCVLPRAGPHLVTA